MTDNDVALMQALVAAGAMMPALLTLALYLVSRRHRRD